MSRFLIDPLEPRLLRAIIHDPSFGRRGEVAVNTVNGSNNLDQAFDLAGAVYVSVQNPSGAYESIRRYTDAGVLDKHWGDRGSVMLPFYGVSQIVYDKWHDKLVISGRDNLNPLNTASRLYVLRLNADGTRDATFGSDGLFTYRPGLSTPSSTDTETDEESAAADPQSIHVLRNGGVLVSMTLTSDDVQSSADDPLGPVDSDIYSIVESTLMRLRPNGTRVPSFGRHGVLRLAVGTTQSHDDSYDSDETADTSQITEVLPLPDGSFKVTLVRRQLQYYDDDGAAISSVFTRTVTAAGTIDRADNAAWRLNKKTWTDIEDGDHDPFTIIGTKTTSDGTIVFSSNAATGYRAYALVPGQPAVAQKLSFPEFTTISKVVALRHGYLATGIYTTADDAVDSVDDTYTAAVRMDENFAVDAGWGNHGSAHILAADITAPPTATLDPDGRLLAWTSDYLFRYLAV